ncbi:hypothetical protein VB636_00475, partial [Paracoccus sp. APAP_BH8]
PAGRRRSRNPTRAPSFPTGPAPISRGSFPSKRGPAFPEHGHFDARRAEQARHWFLSELRAGLLARLDRPEVRTRLREMGDALDLMDENSRGLRRFST